MAIYSYHNFMFPFQWRIDGYDDEVFSEQISLGNIRYGVGINWKRVSDPSDEKELDDLYNERNYFYEFVHDALYDNGSETSLVRHYEREEPKHGKVSYVIDCGEKGAYDLKVVAINLNLYSTGVGVLSFYLYNEKYAEPEHVLRINQAGRRVFPPFFASVKFRGAIANSIEVKGLHGRKLGYREDFTRYTNKMSNLPADFIIDMIREVAGNITLKPVIDDRMYVQCWYKNDEWTDIFCGDKFEDFLYDKHWYEFVFVDDYDGMTCQNEAMQKRLIRKATYERWQKKGSLYGISRYSMVFLTNFQTEADAPYLFPYFETMYARMAELILVQKASVLRFSAEVTNLSNMEVKRSFSGKVSSLYKEYIRFVNQIHFREISAQDQGIEMYQKLYNTLELGRHVEKLDAEIGELYNYVVLKEDHKSSNTMSLLTWIATISVPMTVMAGIFGMNNKHLGGDDYWFNYLSVQLGFVFGITMLVAIGIIIIKYWRLK